MCCSTYYTQYTADAYERVICSRIGIAWRDAQCIDNVSSNFIIFERRSNHKNIYVFRRRVQFRFMVIFCGLAFVGWLTELYCNIFWFLIVFSLVSVQVGISVKD